MKKGNNLWYEGEHKLKYLEHQHQNMKRTT